jgi:GGDEF domain-containing protein
VTSTEDGVLRLAARLARCAGWDEATGLPNLRQFLAELDRELARAVRRGEPLAVLVGDGGPGFPVAQLATVVRSATRREDVVARLGERRVGVVAAACDAVDAHDVAARLMDSFRTSAACVGVRTVAAREARIDDAVRLLGEAVAALERAVATGRGGIEWSPGDSDPRLAPN